MANTIETIRGLLNLPKLTKFYAEGRLDDGRLIVTEADQMAVGVEVKVMNDAGEAADIEDGTYTLEDGNSITIAEGRIAEIGGAEPAAEEAPVEAEEDKEQMASEDEEQMEDKVKDAMKAELEDVVDEATMEKVVAAVKKLMEDEEEGLEEEKVDMSHAFAAELKDFANEVSQVFDVVLSRLERLENEPASKGVQVSPNDFSRQAPAIGDNIPAGPTARAWDMIKNFKNH